MLHTLNVAQTGLKAAQTQVENVMNNIANENVAGYKKRVVDVSELGHADGRITGRGIMVDSVSRTTNVYLYQNIITEEAKLNDLKELNSILEDIESVFSETEDSGVSANLNRYFESIENLRTSPHNEIYKNDIINNANSLVLSLKDLYEGIEKKEESLLSESKEIVNKVNSILTEIGQISKKIVDSGSVVQNDLLDKRDALEKELAQYVDVEITRDDSYHLKIAGVSAVRFDTNVSNVTLIENYIPQQDIYAKVDSTTGNTLYTGINNDHVSSFPSTAFTGTGGVGTSEVQTIAVAGSYDTTGDINFLGTAVTPTGTTSADIASDIDTNSAAIIANWNAQNPHREINSIAASGSTLTITYANTEGNMPPIESSASNGYYFAHSVETTSGSAPVVSETQTIDIFGEVDDGSIDAAGTNKTVQFLGYSIPTTMGADGATLANDILAEEVNIIANWNTNNPDKKILDINVNTSNPNQLQIVYATTEGDVPVIDGNITKGVEFTSSIESVKGSTESLTYILNDKYEMTVTIGETIYEADGVTPADFDNSGAPIGEVTEENIIQALVYRINQDSDIGSTVTAYNGKYELDDDGNKITTDNSSHSKYEAAGTSATGFADRYLFIEANIDGEAGAFNGELLVNDNNDRYFDTRNETVSSDAIDDIHLEVYEKEITVSSGELSPMLNNLKTNDSNNLLQKYKEKLDSFVNKLSDLTSTYIENSDGTFVSGKDSVNLNYDADKAIGINLFTGSNVKTLEFNEGNVGYLTQEKLDYLADMQWDTDINFDGTGENNQSFSEYFQTLRVSIADDRENIIFNEEAQEAVKKALQATYDELTKVDKDDELLNLIKFQKAYEANAKVITVVDEMLTTLLGLKR